MEILENLAPGTPVVWGGNRVTRVSEDLAAAFEPGDSLIVMQTDGALLHVPAAEQQIATDAVDAAAAAFDQMGGVSDEKVSEFYELFASTLADDASFAPIAAANRSDVARAKSRGRSATRLELSDRMRADMIEGLRSWSSAPGGRGSVIESINHDGWRVDQVRDGLGVVGFVFEGRPNVFADAAGVLRSGNTVVFRIGSDALGTARAIVEHALAPALSLTGLPPGAAVLVDSAAHASAWAMFSDPRLALAVARGPGPPRSNSVRSHDRPATRSASTERVGPGSLPARKPIPPRLARRSTTPSTARSATHSTPAALWPSERTSSSRCSSKPSNGPVSGGVFSRNSTFSNHRSEPCQRLGSPAALRSPGQTESTRNGKQSRSRRAILVSSGSGRRAPRSRWRSLPRLMRPSIGSTSTARDLSPH